MWKKKQLIFCRSPVVVSTVSKIFAVISKRAEMLDPWACLSLSCFQLVWIQQTDGQLTTVSLLLLPTAVGAGSCAISDLNWTPKRKKQIVTEKPKYLHNNSKIEKEETCTMKIMSLLLKMPQVIATTSCNTPLSTLGRLNMTTLGSRTLRRWA